MDACAGWDGDAIEAQGFAYLAYRCLHGLPITYPGTTHGFFSDLGRSYNPEGARQAWAKTLDWYAKYLKA